MHLLRSRFRTYKYQQRCNGEGFLRPRPPGIWTLKIPDLGDPREEFPGEPIVRGFRGSPDFPVYICKNKNVNKRKSEKNEKNTKQSRKFAITSSLGIILGVIEKI